MQGVGQQQHKQEEQKETHWAVLEGNLVRPVWEPSDVLLDINPGLSELEEVHHHTQGVVLGRALSPERRGCAGWEAVLVCKPDLVLCDIHLNLIQLLVQDKVLEHRQRVHAAGCC